MNEAGIDNFYWLLSNPRNPTLNQRAIGSASVRPSNSINDLDHLRQYPVRGKPCFWKLGCKIRHYPGKPEFLLPDSSPQGFMKRCILRLPLGYPGKGENILSQQKICSKLFWVESDQSGQPNAYQVRPRHPHSAQWS